jgi:hypothetical protein
MTKRQFFVALVVLFVGGVIGGAFNAWLMPGGPAWAQGSAATVKEVRAERFALVDASGRGRASLEIVEGGDSALRLFDESGKSRMILRMEHGQPQIGLMDEAGVRRAELSLGTVPMSDGRPSLWFTDAAGNSRASLRQEALVISDVEREPRTILNEEALVLFDAAGNVRAAVSNKGEPSLMFFDETSPRVNLGFSEGEPKMVLLDANRQRVVLGSTTTESTITGAETTFPISTMTLFGETGHVQWQAP